MSPADEHSETEVSVPHGPFIPQWFHMKSGQELHRVLYQLQSPLSTYVWKDKGNRFHKVYFGHDYQVSESVHKQLQLYTYANLI